MVVRKEKRCKKRLGTRTRGAGNTENRRGAGSKGGKGNTGKFGHKKHEFFDVIGHKVKNKAFVETVGINFNHINNYIENLILQGKKEPFELDFKHKDLKKYNKVLSKGKLKYNVILKNVILTERAKKQVESKGGSFE
jgi:large subunit ribosomal protein L15